MFLDKYIPAKFQVKTEVCALEICLRDEGTSYYYSHFRNRNNKLELIATGTSLEKPELPASLLKNKVPLVLVINGRGVIVKKISLTETAEQKPEEVIHRNLPAVNLDDFFAQLYRQSDQSAFIALCRKEQVNQILAGLIHAKYEIADVLLGAPAIIGLQPLWRNFNTLPASLHRAELSNNLLDTLGALPAEPVGPVKIESLQFEAVYTLGFAGGLSYLLRRRIADNCPGGLQDFYARHTEKNKFRILTLVVVGIAFVLAIGNVLFYTTYFDRNNKLETELSVYQGKYEQVNQLLENYQQNKALIENAGILNRNRLSEYADRIGKTLPDDVVLCDLYFNPRRDSGESEDSLITFSNKSLILKGNCSKSFIVNEWINVLKMQKFIKQVNLEKFVYNNQGLLPNFEIRLTTE